MVAPRLRSRSTKRLQRRTATRKGVAIYKAKRVSRAVCADCGNYMNAVPNRSVVGMRKLAKTEKRPERVFGGVLCHNCVERILKQKIRMQAGVLKREEIPPKDLKFLDVLKRF